jgi:hypothetical protein
MKKSRLFGGGWQRGEKGVRDRLAAESAREMLPLENPSKAWIRDPWGKSA